MQFDCILDGSDYRPTIKRPPSEANLRRVRERLEVIKRQIEVGLFSFEEEFPDYRFLRRLSGTSMARSCADVLNDYLSHCEARLRRDDMAAATVRGYRKVLDGIWRPRIGHLVFSQVRYSHLVAIADGHAGARRLTTTSLAFSNVPSISVIGTARPRGTRLTASVALGLRKNEAGENRPLFHTRCRDIDRGRPSRLGRSTGKLRRVPVLHGSYGLQSKSRSRSLTSIL